MASGLVSAKARRLWRSEGKGKGFGQPPLPPRADTVAGREMAPYKVGQRTVPGHLTAAGCAGIGGGGDKATALPGETGPGGVYQKKNRAEGEKKLWNPQRATRLHFLRAENEKNGVWRGHRTGPLESKQMLCEPADGW